MREIKFIAAVPGWENEKGNVPGIEVIALDNSYKQHGYVKRKVTEHPYADKRGYVMEHRLVMEQHMGKFLPKNAVIHHINQIRDDNRLENLEYMEEQARHAKHHEINKRNTNGQYLASDPAFTEIKFRLLNKNTGLMQIFTLAKLIGTTFRHSQFEFRGRWTGLKDKNGKEIYEGDIVTDYSGEKGSIEFAKYVTDNEANEDIMAWVIQTPLSAVALDPQTTDDLEVIGNIYENPELLKL